MKVRITKSTEFVGASSFAVEGFCLEVEKEPNNTEGETAEVYLALRKKLMEGLKEEVCQ